MNTQSYVLRTVHLKPKVDTQIRNESLKQRVSMNDMIRHYLELGLREFSKTKKK